MVTVVESTVVFNGIGLKLYSIVALNHSVFEANRRETESEVIVRPGGAYLPRVGG